MEVLKGEKTVNEIASAYGVLPLSLKNWNKQCKLLEVSKSSLYYIPTKPFSSGKDIKVLDAINNIYSDFPSYGSRRIHSQLLRDDYSE